MGTIVQAVLVGMLVMAVGTIPRNLLFAANLRYFPSFPWAVPLTAVYLWFFWRVLKGTGASEATAEERRASLHANAVGGRVWAWVRFAGGLGIVSLVLALRVANRLLVLPQQQLPDLAQVPKLTVLALLVMAAPGALIWKTGVDRPFLLTGVSLILVSAVAVWSYRRLAAIARETHGVKPAPVQVCRLTRRSPA